MPTKTRRDPKRYLLRHALLLHFSSEEYDFLCTRAIEDGISVNEVIRRRLSLPHRCEPPAGLYAPGGGTVFLPEDGACRIITWEGGEALVPFSDLAAFFRQFLATG